MSYQILTFSTTSEHSYLEDPGLQICEDGLSTLPVNPQSLTSWDPTTVVYSTKSKVLLQSHSHREITKKNVLPVHANSMIMWTLEETSCWEAVDKSCQGVKHTFRALKPWSSVLCFRMGTVSKCLNQKSEASKTWSLFYHVYKGFLLASRQSYIIYILEIFGGSCSIYIYYMYIIICISSASIPVLTSSSTSCWNPFCNCGLGAGTKKNWRNMWQMYTNVTKLMHIDENKTLSNSGQIKHI
jgi:hypothetical protein